MPLEPRCSCEQQTKQVPGERSGGSGCRSIGSRGFVTSVTPAVCKDPFCFRAASCCPGFSSLAASDQGTLHCSKSQLPWQSPSPRLILSPVRFLDALLCLHFISHTMVPLRGLCDSPSISTEFQRLLAGVLVCSEPFHPIPSRSRTPEFPF